jgi:CelD/BcsL family acetyltransferase involved in cellulose biosynthesis
VIERLGTERSVSAPSALAGAASPEPNYEPNVDTLTRDIITDLDGIRGLSADYEQLYRSTANSLPFALQEWHLAWCEHFLNHSRLIQDQPFFCVLRAADCGCAAILPLIYSRRRIGPLGVATVSLVGADPALTEIRNPLIKPGYERPAVRAAHAGLAELPGWDWIQWDRVSDSVAEALNLETTPHWYGSCEDCILDLPASWEELRTGLKRNARESLRHCYNSLRRDGHAFELVVTQQPAEVPRALDQFLKLHAMRADMLRSPIQNRFTGPRARAFLYDVCTRLAMHNALRIFQLRIAEATVASRIGLVVGDSIYLLHYSGFDPAWARYSVMTTTLAESLKYAIASGIKSVNLSVTANQAKAFWQPRRITFRSALVHRKALSSRILSAAYRLTMRQGLQGNMLKAISGPRRGRD